MGPQHAFTILAVISIPAGFTVLVAAGIARQVARQRIAENLLRERLARSWGRARPPQEQVLAGDGTNAG